MSEKKKMVNVGTIGHIDHNKVVISEAMERAFQSSLQKIEYPEIAVLKQRISDLEQQLKTAKQKAFIAGFRYAGTGDHIDEEIKAEEYANNLEGK